MKTKSLGLVWIVVKDVKKAVKYYTDVVGLQLKEFHEEYGWAELQGHDGGCLLGISQYRPGKEDWTPGDNSCPTFTVENLDHAKKEAQQKGAQFHGDIIEIPGHVRMQMVEDADGNKFQLVQKLW